MDRAEVLYRVRGLVAEQCAVSLDRLQNDTKLRYYGLDSSRAYELVILLEDTFAIRIPPSALDTLQSIDDVVDAVLRRLPAPR